MAIAASPTAECIAGSKGLSGMLSREKFVLLLTDFTENSANLGWSVLNDNVMGGRSEGSFEQAAGQLHFSGRADDCDVRVRLETVQGKEWRWHVLVPGGDY